MYRSLTHFDIGTVQMDARPHSYFLTFIGFISHYCNGVQLTVQLAVNCADVLMLHTYGLQGLSPILLLNSGNVYLVLQ
jgi:hypothetical protein